MKKTLITGAAGQIGTELTAYLRNIHGADNVIATDICKPSDTLQQSGPYEHLDVTDKPAVFKVVREQNVGVIYHLAAILSAVGETKPHAAWNVNMNGSYNMLEAGRKEKCTIFIPSSIAAFGPDTPKNNTPQDTLQRPTSMYGVTKVAGEILCDYYFQRFQVDVRGVRYPGLISYEAPPGGGTTDYAVEIFYEAIQNKKYTCFLGPDTRLDMMYMSDALKAAVDLMNADPAKLNHRNAFNITAFSFTPEELATEIKKHIPEFEIQYEVDPCRQSIADSWPSHMDDSAAREEWNWSPEYTFEAMVKDMLEKLQKKLHK